MPYDVAALATSTPSGGLTIPNGRTLPDGAVVLGLNNALDPQFYRYDRADNFQFGIGLFRYVEITGRLANILLRDGRSGQRDLSANVKISLPKLIRFQPDIAIGRNDLGGGAPFFRSTYLAISEDLGPVRLTVGTARGQPYLSRVFGGAELRVGTTGLSVLVERNNDAYYGGLRYASPPISALGDARLLATAIRSAGSHAPDGSKFASRNLGVQLLIPFGGSTPRTRKIDTELEPLWTPPAPKQTAADPVTKPAAAGPSALPAIAPDTSLPAGARPSLHAIQAELATAGLERLRIGLAHDTVIVEFENHRYNQNEVDAIGIALGVAAVLAPPGIQRVAIVVKKANQAMYGVSVDQADYRQFLRDGDAGGVQPSLQFQMRPSYGNGVRWLDVQDGPHGWSRFRIDPVLTKFVGTEIGVFDYSLAANLQGFVPLWKGAEFSTSYIATLANSENFRNGGLLAYAKLSNGLKSAVVSQSFWLGEHLHSVVSAGKFMYDARGVQNETTYFVPGRNDQVRLQYTYLRHAPLQPDAFSLHQETDTKGASVSYLWNYQPLGTAVELAYTRFTGKDYGPTLQASRWFGDVQAQLFVRRSNLETRIGFGLAFPLTPRRGMQPGLTHVEGPGSFPLRLETRLAREGERNTITNGVLQEIPLVYSAKSNFFNEGRLGKDYLLSQLRRMREAVLAYTTLAP